ncbi:MAG TPA: methyltransferase domain-containing protein [Stellaceae bacterium]|nr:methyltransferase domain-containing protein [Stellaceae bacterium]
MRRIEYDPSWPESWRLSHRFDEIEMWGSRANLGHGYAYATRYEHVMRAVRALAAPPARILDFAGGQGNFAIGFAEQGYSVVWNDVREDLAGYVRLKDESGHIVYRPGNLFDFGAAGEFDIVFAGEVIEHVAHPDELLRKLASLVKRDGHVVITTPNGRYFRNNLPRFSDCPDPSVYEAIQFKPDVDGHIFLLHPDEIHALAAQAGLVVEKIESYANPLTAGHVKLGHVLPFLPAAFVRIAERLTSNVKFADRIHTDLLVVMRRQSPL